MSTIGAYGGGGSNPLLLSLLNRLTPSAPVAAVQNNDISSSISGSAADPAAAASSNNNLSGSPKAQLSDQVLRLLTMMQDASNANAGAGGTSSTAIGASSAQDGLSKLMSAVDTDGDGSISQSEMESFIEGKGGTQAQADALFSGLNQSNTGNLTQAQLASDLQNATPLQGRHGHHHHHHHGDGAQASAGDVASQLMKAMDSNNDGSLSQSEFENFVTSIGGTTNEADKDFSALNAQGNSGITADQLTSAISTFQSSTATPTEAKNAILTMLDNLGTAPTNGTASA